MWFVYSFNLQSGAVTCYVLKCYFIAFEQCLSLKWFFQNNNQCSKLPWCSIRYKYCCNYRSHLRYGKWDVHSWKQYWESTDIKIHDWSSKIIILTHLIDLWLLLGKIMCMIGLEHRIFQGGAQILFLSLILRPLKGHHKSFLNMPICQ